MIKKGSSLSRKALSNSKQSDGVNEIRHAINPSECFKVTEDPKWIDINEIKSKNFL